VKGSRKVARATLLSLFGVALAAAPAQAAVRYADPASSTTSGACAASAPCTIRAAIQGASSGDEVVVRPGSYGSASARMPLTITGTAAGLYIHGVSGQPRPRLYFSSPGDGLLLSGPATVRDLEVDNPPGNGLEISAGASSLVERVVVSAGGGSGWACLVNGGTIRDSLCLDGGSDASAIYVSPSGDANVAVRNVTALASGPSAAGIEAIAARGASVDVTVRNAIARGNPDLKAGTATVSGGAAIHVGYSNYTTTSAPTSYAAVIEDPPGTNQSAAPLLVNPSLSELAINGDYSQRAGSPTIDAGVQDPANGALDLSGGPRTVGASTDIGADEYDPLQPQPQAQPLIATSQPGPLIATWAPEPPRQATLFVAPSTVKRGGVVRLYGSVAGGCAAGARVTVYSRAFAGRRRGEFAGVPAVFTRVRRNGTFTRRVRIGKRIAPRRYGVGGRCGGGTFGSAKLRVARRAHAGLRRVAVENRFVRLASRLEPRARHLFPRTFAGSWIGRGKWAGKVFVAFKARSRRSVARLRRGLPKRFSRRLKVVIFKRSLLSLERLQRLMIHDRERLRRGAAIRQLSAAPGAAYDLDIDVMKNVPVVTVEHRTAALVDAFKQRYGKFVVVKQGPLFRPEACTRDDCGILLRAGRLAYRKFADGHIGKICTTGFTVRERVRRVHQRLGILSAGHCSRLDDAHLNVENPYTERGARLGGNLYKFGDKITDVMQGPVDAEWSTDDRHPFTAGNACIWVPIKHLYYCGVVRQVAEKIEDLPLGLRLCKSGVTTGFTCGNVVSKNESPHYVPNATNFVATTFCSNEGDSGSPVFLQSERLYKAFGILSGGLDYSCGDPRERSIFSHLEFVQKQLHVSVLTWDRLKQEGVCTTPTNCTPTGSEP
jgi:hypothetical protein